MNLCEKSLESLPCLYISTHESCVCLSVFTVRVCGQLAFTDCHLHWLFARMGPADGSGVELSLLQPGGTHPPPYATVILLSRLVSCLTNLEEWCIQDSCSIHGFDLDLDQGLLACSVSHPHPALDDLWVMDVDQFLSRAGEHCAQDLPGLRGPFSC